MNMLRDDLQNFARALRGQEAWDQAGIEVYRANYFGNLRDALATAYPVTLQLVGEDFFRMLARDFITHQPSRSGNLHLYGEELARFVAGYVHAHGIPYLVDMIKLEWACHRAYFADDESVLDVRQLAQVDSQHYTHLRLLLNSGCSIMRSPYPVIAIWHAHQPDTTQDFNIDFEQGACNALVCRKLDVVEVHELSDASANWLSRIQADVSLGHATEATCARYPDFDLQLTLLNLVMQGALAGFELTVPVEKT